MAAPTHSQYAPTTEQIQPPKHNGHPSDTGLPLTGFDLTILAVLAVALLGSALGLRRAARKPSA